MLKGTASFSVCHLTFKIIAEGNCCTYRYRSTLSFCIQPRAIPYILTSQRNAFTLQRQEGIATYHLSREYKVFPKIHRLFSQKLRTSEYASNAMGYSLGHSLLVKAYGYRTVAIKRRFRKSAGLV